MEVTSLPATKKTPKKAAKKTANRKESSKKRSAKATKLKRSKLPTYEAVNNSLTRNDEAMQRLAQTDATLSGAGETTLPDNDMTSSAPAELPWREDTPGYQPERARFAPTTTEPLSTVGDVREAEERESAYAGRPDHALDRVVEEATREPEPVPTSEQQVDQDQTAAEEAQDDDVEYALTQEPPRRFWTLSKIVTVGVIVTVIAGIAARNML